MCPPRSKSLCACVCAGGPAKWLQLCLTLSHPIDCSPPGSPVHGILQATILEAGSHSPSRGSSQARDWTWVSNPADRFFTSWATREAPIGASFLYTAVSVSAVQQSEYMWINIWNWPFRIIHYWENIWGKVFQFRLSVVSDCLWPHGLQHARLPCASPSPRVCSNSCPLSQ